MDRKDALAELIRPLIIDAAGCVAIFAILIATMYIAHGLGQ